MTHILIVDDEDMIREELKESLEFEDFQVTTAATAVEALERAQGASFNVVVTDLKMPKMGGLELIEKLRAQGSDAIIFVVSGHGAASNRSEALRLGAVGCFSKPLDVEELIDAIQSELAA